MNGVLVIDKPEGFTSHDVVGKVRRILKMKSVGHTGTLDPFATGVLVVLVGKATRLAQFLDKAEKEYLATVRFGWETDTGDRTGSPKSEPQTPKPFSHEEIETILNDFRGEIWQTPPMYSAKKVAGKKLYELARKGETIERQPVKIVISELELATDFDEESKIQNPKSKINLRVVCSAGTYIRVLAEDIGKKLNWAAHLAELRRTRAGRFAVSQAVTLDDLAGADRTSALLVTPNDALAHLPQRILTEREITKTINGVKIETGENFGGDKTFVRLCDASANLIAVAVWDKVEMTLKPSVVFGATEKNG